MKYQGLALSSGIALFSMFFGSGNLVFPIAVGQESLGHYGFAAFGILLTGVLVPFLGIFGMLLHEGNLHQFFNSFGKKGIFLFSLIALALLGPFGAVARCLTVAHGALILLIPKLSLPWTSFILCLFIYFLSVKKQKIISLLGTVLTPFLLIAIAMIAYYGFQERDINQGMADGQWQALKNGFFQGYQTMDLLAAFFFSQFIISYLCGKCSNRQGEGKEELFKVFGLAALIGAILLSLVYTVLVILGWIYAPLLDHQPPQEMLGIIAMASLGPMAAPCVCLAVVFACMTTAIVLTSLFAEFLQQEVTKKTINYEIALLFTLTIAFFVSTLDFMVITTFLSPLLEAIYPALIVFTLMNIFAKLYEIKMSHWPFTFVFFTKLLII